MAEFRTRIRNVTLKGGMRIVRLPTAAEKDRSRCLQDVLAIVREADDVAGWAFVVWGPDGSSCATMGVPRSNIPSILVPDFVRNRLLAYRIEGWTLETVNGQTGA